MVKWGIMATGNIAGVFAEAIIRSHNAELTAVASRDYSKAEAFADKFGISKAYGNYEGLATDKEVEIIYIATPMSCHYENVKLCLENGKNVLCEKAVTLNYEQLNELILLAKEKGLFFMEAMWTKFLPAQNKAVEWINQGKIGKIKYIKADFCINASYNPQGRLFSKELGGGAMLDLGVYAISFVCDFLGYEPEKIMTAANIGETGVDFDSTILLRFADAAASLNIGFSTSADNGAAIIGETGKIIFDSCFMNTKNIRLFDKYGKLSEEYKAEYEGWGYEFEIEEVQNSLRDNLKESRRNPLWQTSAVMKIMDECRKTWGVRYEGEQ